MLANRGAPRCLRPYVNHGRERGDSPPSRTSPLTVHRALCACTWPDHTALASSLLGDSGELLMRARPQKSDL